MVEEKYIINKLKYYLGEKIYNKLFFYNLNLNKYELGHLLEEIEESENFYNFRWVTKPSGIFQNRGYLKIYVDQEEGYNGDDFFGEIYVRISKKKWLCWSYEM